MTTRPLVCDALWKCLCPSFTPALLSRHVAHSRAIPSSCAPVSQARHHTARHVESLDNSRPARTLCRPPLSIRHKPRTSGSSRCQYATLTRPKWGLQREAENPPGPAARIEEEQAIATPVHLGRARAQLSPPVRYQAARQPGAPPGREERRSRREPRGERRPLRQALEHDAHDALEEEGQHDPTVYFGEAVKNTFQKRQYAQDMDDLPGLEDIAAAMTGCPDPVGYQEAIKLQVGMLGTDTQKLHTASFEELLHLLPRAVEKRMAILISYLLYRIIHDHGVAPYLELYNAQIFANIDSSYGSAQVAEDILEEMRRNGIEPDTTTYAALLEVLAVHPNALFRARILAEMRFKWIPTTSRGWHSIVAGNLREIQPEMALEHYARALQHHEVKFDPWLTLSLVYQLLNLDEVDAAYRVLASHPFKFSTRHFSPAVWAAVFDAACQTLNYNVLAPMWDAQEQHRRFVPSAGQCTAVLHAAALHADTRIAAAAFEMLSHRGHHFVKLHSELLLMAYANAGDVNTALAITTVMANAGSPPDAGSTRPIYRALVVQAEPPETAWEHLQALKSQGRHIPLETATVVLEGVIDHAAGQEEPTRARRSARLEQAVVLFSRLGELVSSSPKDARTYNIMLQGCANAQRKDIADHLAAEMHAAGLEPSQETYEALIRVCLVEQSSSVERDLRDAWGYYQEMMRMDKRPRKRTVRLFLETLCEHARTRQYREWGRDMARQWDAARAPEMVHFWKSILEERWGEEESEK